VLVAFLGCCLWAGLKKVSPTQRAESEALADFGAGGGIALVEVWFELRAGRRVCLPRITQPEPAQAGELAQLNWSLPQQPPPRV